jgi:hypothetical protein
MGMLVPRGPERRVYVVGPSDVHQRVLGDHVEQSGDVAAVEFRTIDRSADHDDRVDHTDRIHDTLHPDEFGAVDQRSRTGSGAATCQRRHRVARRRLG